MYSELVNVPGIRVIPSQANYFMIELTNGMNSRELMKELFDKENLLIKDLSKKVYAGQYIRIAIRGRDDNDRMIAALKRHVQ